MKKKTYKRYVVIKGCKQDFGLGPGVIARDEITLTDKNGWGFDNALAQCALIEHAEEMLKKSATVLHSTEKKWDKDPQATYRREHPEKFKGRKRSRLTGREALKRSR